MRLRGFAVAKGFEDRNIILPVRKSKCSAGYDIQIAEDVVIPPIMELIHKMKYEALNPRLDTVSMEDLKGLTEDEADQKIREAVTFTFDEISKVTKENKIQPTLIKTGVKAYMQDDEVLKLYIRSSCPLKSFLIMANSVGIIDSDYYSNKDNDGHIMFQIVNFSNVPILLKKGETIGQGVFEKYLITDNDGETEKQERTGGFGSTNK